MSKPITPAAARKLSARDLALDVDNREVWIAERSRYAATYTADLVVLRAEVARRGIDITADVAERNALLAPKAKADTLTADAADRIVSEIGSMVCGRELVTFARGAARVLTPAAIAKVPVKTQAEIVKRGKDRGAQVLASFRGGVAELG